MSDEILETNSTELGGEPEVKDDQTDDTAKDDNVLNNEKGSEEKDIKETKDEKESKDEKDDKKSDKKEEDDRYGKPDSYDFKDVKLPENMELDEAMTGKFAEYAAKLNLSQKSANDVMAMAVELTEQTQKQTVEAMGKLQEAKIEGYKVLLNKDKEVGGANLKNSIETANVAYDGFFKDEGLRELLAESGLTVHPKFIKALKAIGSQMKEDKIHNSGSNGGEKRSREDILFSSMDEKE